MGARTAAALLAAAVAVAGPAGAQAERPCFDMEAGRLGPLGPSLALVEGEDQSLYGTDPNGLDWAATRALVRRPVASLLLKLLDHRNVKDMKRTRLDVRWLASPACLRLCQLDVDVTLKALFVKLHVRWTEEWAYRLVEGTPLDPRRVVIHYQKIAGTEHLKHQCGAYVLQELGPQATDVSLYEEIQAKRRSALDTRNMQQGILRNLRGDAWPAPPLPASAR